MTLYIRKLLINNYSASCECCLNLEVHEDYLKTSIHGLQRKKNV